MMAQWKMACGILLSLVGSDLLAAQGPLGVSQYAIVAEASVMADEAWVKSVEALQKKYPAAHLFTFTSSPEEVKPQLAATLPQYTAIVAKPETVTQHFVINLSQLCRDLDDDPWVDTFWGIITGYEAEAAEQIAAAGPIAIERALDCAGMNLTPFGEAWRYSEDKRGTMVHWKRGMAEPKETPCPTDNTHAFLTRLQHDKIQFLTTSGHATEHNWDMGYCGPNLWLSHAEGKLIAIDTRKQPYFARSEEPKLYIATGNCLIGNIDRPDCMALSWMKDGGVRQMVGYVVTTWFGAQGWGTMNTFVNSAGLYTANEAFHFVNTENIQFLKRTETTEGLTDLLDYRMQEIGLFNIPMTAQLQAWANKHHAENFPQDENDKAKFDARLRQIIGNLHDKDTVTFLGDPALNVRIAEGVFSRSPWIHQNDSLTCTITAHAGAPEVGVWIALPGSFTYEAISPTPIFACDNMIALPKTAHPDGEVITLTLRGVRPKTQHP